MSPNDIKRINYIYYSSFRTFVKSPHSLFVCYVLFILRTVVYVLLIKFKCKPLRDILVIAPSLNNKKAVKTIIDNLPLNNVSVWDKFGIDLPLARIYLNSIFHIKPFQDLYNMSPTEDRLLIRQFYTNFMSTSGIYVTFNKIFKKNPNLKLIILANDHITASRCLIELAEKTKIKTLYVQHASVTERFPPLNFDYSFLDGIESYEKYRGIDNVRGNVYITGSPRFDVFQGLIGKGKIYDVGIAINMLDSVERVIELCQYLKQHYTSKIVVRPHPLMYEAQFDESLFLSLGIDISNPLQDFSHIFLSTIKVMVANESSIHLDAALMGVPSVLYNFGYQSIVDWYSYIKHGLITVCVSKEDLVEKLSAGYDLPVKAVRYYVASFHSQFEGKVGELIASFIKLVLYESPDTANDYIEQFMVNRGEYYEYRA